MPLLIFLAKAIVSSAAFVAAESVVEKLVEKDGASLIDEVAGVAAGVGVGVGVPKLNFLKDPKVLPLPQNVSTPAQVADYLESIAANKAGLTALNARLGGFAPLAIKFTKAVARVFTKKGVVVTAGVLVLWKIVNWLIWLPQLVQQFWDQGTFSPEQANTIMESWNLPWRWPISEARATETALKELSLEQKLAGALGSVGGPRTIIRMVEEKKPEQFIGTLFSFKLGSAESFERKVDDEITDMADLKEDIKLNLNHWLQTLPARLGASIVIRKDPVDETGSKQSGIWATLTMFITHISGKTTPIDTILLGPVKPAVRLELARQTKTIENQIPELIQSMEVRQVDVPKGTVDIFDTTGELVASSEIPTPALIPSELGVPTVKKDEFDVETEKISKGDREAIARQEERIREADKTPKTPPPGQTTTPAVQAPPGGKIEGWIPELGAYKGSIVLSDTPGGGLNIRSDHSTSARIFVTVPNNTRLTVLGEHATANGLLWGKVGWSIPGASSGEGWVAWDFVKAV
ncbi:SH3 domain-containing protein [Candidatus Wolfebacteria bacterium]|nr:SH3 domain-containing protein [Candidatus Wolfebacteria bacterium]